MFKHTRAYLKLIQDEISLFSFIANLTSSLFMIGYMIYSLIVGRGILAVNITLLSLALVNLAVYLVSKAVKSRGAEKFRRLERHIYNLSRIVINAVPLAAVIYSLAFTGEELSKIEMVFLPLMILLWIFQTALELVTLYLESRLRLFADAIALDYEPIRRVVNSSKGDSSANDRSAVSDKNRALLSDMAKQYARESKSEDEENEPVVKDGWITRISNATEAIKELIKK